ncbi:hypothetical protein DFH08DRAFT_272978 [Mycena albidolilacea]|uniref:Uncharacterized protein n=1 Tax=Mycena albidolilacea TaxID=1033008 RepID=A0AAD7AP20_9AGAR|nr:hypothetical protein DFH08DRAFT_272978 [Mycena albidolilacea]
MPPRIPPHQPRHHALRPCTLRLPLRLASSSFTLSVASRMRARAWRTARSASASASAARAARTEGSLCGVVLPSPLPATRERREERRQGDLRRVGGVRRRRRRRGRVGARCAEAGVFRLNGLHGGEGLGAAAAAEEAAADRDGVVVGVGRRALRCAYSFAPPPRSPVSGALLSDAPPWPHPRLIRRPAPSFSSGGTPPSPRDPVCDLHRTDMTHHIRALPSRRSTWEIGHAARGPWATAPRRCSHSDSRVLAATTVR